MRRTAALLLFLASSTLWAQPAAPPAASDLLTTQVHELANPPMEKGTDGQPVVIGLSVSFAANSAAFQPSREQIGLLADVRKANLVMVKGRTSTTIPTAKDDALALSRARAARNWLVGLGVSPLKIYVNYIPAGDHKDDNSTKAGRAANQRVDIEAYFVATRTLTEELP